MAGDLRLLFDLRRTLVRNRLRTLLRESRFKAVVIFSLASLFWVGFFWSFYEAFRFLNTFEGVASVMHDIVFALFFMSLFIMLTFSNAIIGFSSFYRSSEIETLMTCPVSVSALLAYRFLEGTLFSSWAFMLLAAPFLVAFGLNSNAHPAFYPCIFLFFLPFVIMPAALGNLLALALTAWFPRNRGKVLGTFVGGIILVLAVAGLRETLWRPSDNLFSMHWMQSILGNLSFAQNPYLPSRWMARGIIACASGAFTSAGFYLLLLLANSMFAYALLDGVYSRWFLFTWRKAREAYSPTKRKKSIGIFSLAGSRSDMLIMKDIKMFVRDPVQWSQCAILFGIMALYILNLRNFNYHVAEMFWKNIVAFLNLTATSLTMATLMTRFVFPMISLEGQRFWILGLAPVSRRQILNTKFAFVLSGSFLITAVLVVLSNLMLQTLSAVMLLQLCAALMICTGLSGLTIGLGVIFPNFKEDDPSRIVSGFGGTLTLVLSMFYVAAIVILVLVPCHYYLVESSLSDRAFMVVMGMSLAVGALLTAGVCGIPMWLGRRAFDRLEL